MRWCDIWGCRIRPIYRWRIQYGAVRPDDMARLKTLERENARLKKLLSEKELDNDMLLEVAKGKW